MAKRGLTVESVDGSVKIGIHPERLREEHRRLMGKLANAPASRMEVLLTGKALCDGPKVFRPRQVDLEVLEQMTANVEVADYEQPFQTLVVELPDEYVAQKSVHNPIGDEWLYGRREPLEHCPVMVIIQHWREVGLVCAAVFFNTGVSVKLSLKPEPGRTLEDSLQGFTREDEWGDTLPTSDQEWEVVKGLMRACINFCMLVAEVGHRRLGPEDPASLKRLQKHAEAFRRRGGEPLARAKARVQACPVVYELDQQVQLYRTVARSEDLPAEPTGRKMPPHHRRGYWRMQPHGPKNSLRKRVRILPVFVNSHLFAGDMSRARVTYS